MRRRPRVVVYVTREHPVTGADQLLVFDPVEQPDFSAVVPGGGIEPGETAAEAVVREVREETGIDVRVLRELGMVEQPGRLEPDFLHETHFFEATLAEPAPDEWEHEIAGADGGIEAGLVRCRWLPIRADMDVWGKNRGAFLRALVRERVVAYVTRGREGRTELLTIEHGDIPEAGVQVPAGRLDPGEDLESGLRREVAEETGVTGLRIVRQLADGEEFERLYGAGAHKSFAYHAAADDDGRDEWEHPVAGSGADAGFTYVCRWVPLEADLLLWGRRDPLLQRLAEPIEEA
jgi:ADP-ribose pyrophosphatase YjhB (NUDIX family)